MKAGIQVSHSLLVAQANELCALDRFLWIDHGELIGNDTNFPAFDVVSRILKDYRIRDVP